MNTTQIPAIEKTAEGFRVTIKRGSATETRTFGFLGGAEAKKFFDAHNKKP